MRNYSNSGGVSRLICVVALRIYLWDRGCRNASTPKCCIISNTLFNNTDWTTTTPTSSYTSPPLMNPEDTAMIFRTCFMCWGKSFSLRRTDRYLAWCDPHVGKTSGWKECRSSVFEGSWRKPWMKGSEISNTKEKSE